MTREEINKDKQAEIFNEERKQKTKEVIKKVLKAFVIVFIISISFFSYETYIATQKIEVREYRIKNKKIPDSFNGIKILQISDIHYGSTFFDKNLKEIVKLTNERKPDIIVFTGDLIDKNYELTKDEQDKIIKHLLSLNSTLGKYAIDGNEDSDNINTILHQSGFTILKNESDLIYNKSNNPILFIGLSSLLKNNQNIESGYSYFLDESCNSNIFTITLIHEPDSTEDIVNLHPNTDLILAGHSHNGDIRIPIIKFPVLRKEGAYKYNQETYKVNKTKLFISGGLGTNNALGMRLFTRPSINLYRISNN